MEPGNDILLYHEDCLDTLQRLSDGSIDVILQDPPYAVTRNDWDVKVPLPIMWPEWKRVIKNNGPIIFFAQQPFVSELVVSELKMFRYDLIWHKTAPTGFLNARRMPLRCHEHIIVCYKRLPVYNAQKTSGHPRKVSSISHKKGSIKTSNYGDHELSGYDSTERFPGSVLLFKSDKQKSALHPTQKPLALIRWLIRSFSNTGDVVFDGYAGSGTTAVACQQENRRFIGSERDNKFYKVAFSRIAYEWTNPTDYGNE